MNAKQLLKKTAEDFDLKFNPKNKFKYLALTNRELIIRNFLSTCPDPPYIKYRGENKKNRKKTPLALMKYFQTEDYKRELTKTHGCVISKKELKAELKLIQKIPNEKIKDKIKNFYKKIKQEIGKSKRLTLIWKPSKSIRKGILNRKEILLHEFVHELLEDNGIRPKSWKWNEGLVTYITHFTINTHKKFENSPPIGEDKMWNIYARYTHKWAKLLKNSKDPKERKRIILKKIRTIKK